MDGDRGVDNGAAASAHTSHEETERFKVIIEEQKRKILELMEKLEKERREHEETINDILAGKENVIVVVDDLQTTDQSEKRRILDGQPSMRRLARDLYLFSDKKKNTDSLEEIKQIILKKIPTSNNMDTDLKRRYGNYTPEKNQSESPGQDRSLRTGSVSSGSSRQQGPGHRPHVSSSNYSTDLHSLQVDDVQPSASGIHPNVGSLHDDSDETEGPEAKKTNLERNFLEQINFSQLYISVVEQLEDVDIKGQQFIEAIKVTKLAPLIREVFQKVQTEIPRMEAMLQDKDKMIISLTRELELKNEIIQSDDSKMCKMERELEEKTSEIGKLQKQMELMEIEGKEEKEKNIIITDLPVEIKTMQSEIERLEEKIQRGNREQIENQIYGENNRMRQKRMDGEEREVRSDGTMDGDRGVDNGAAASAHTSHEETERFKVIIEEQKRKILEVMEKLEKEKREHEETKDKDRKILELMEKLEKERREHKETINDILGGKKL